MDTGSRLTCLTVVPPDSLLRELKQPVRDGTTGEESLAQAGSFEPRIPHNSTGEKRTKEKQKPNEKGKSSQEYRGQEERKTEPDVHRSRKRKLAKRLGYDVTKSGKRKSLSGKTSKRRMLVSGRFLLAIERKSI